MDSNTLITEIPTLGKATLPSPLKKRVEESGSISFVSDQRRVIIEVDEEQINRMFKNDKAPPSFELAGPRQKVFFDASKVKCALVTCGGLCPGINDIIRSIVLELHYAYGVRHIFGIRYGLQGFIAKYGHDIVDLTPEAVVNIHDRGGTVLGSSRGPQNIDEIIDCLEKQQISVYNGPTLQTTYFINDIRTRKRKQQNPLRAAPIHGSQIWAHLQFVNFIHLGPLHPEDIDRGAINL